jgi:hypothetical protein
VHAGEELPDQEERSDENGDGHARPREILLILGELAERLGGLIPPEAQVHLLAAQAELVKAVRATLEHHLASANAVPPEVRERTRRRPMRIEID